MIAVARVSRLIEDIAIHVSIFGYCANNGILIYTILITDISRCGCDHVSCENRSEILFFPYSFDDWYRFIISN